MDSRFVDRTLHHNSVNENASLSIKNSLVAQTPRKLPFSDQTNKAEGLLRSALKLKSFKSENSQSSQEKQSTSSKSAKEEASGFSYEEDAFETFTFPPDKNCYCCGSDRKTDEEVWGEQLALPVDLLNEMTNFFIPMHNQDFFEPFSPVKIQPIHRSFEDEIEEFPERVSEAEFIDVPNVSFDSSLLDSSNYTLALEFSVLSDDQDSTPDVPDPDDSQNSIIDVPDHEISYELEAEASNAANDNSILRDW